MNPKTANFQTRVEEEHREVNGVKVKAVTPYGFDGASLVPMAGGAQAIKSQVVADVTYLGMAPAGSLQSAAIWRAMKIDQSSGVVITWADGDANYDNVATDLTALAYS